VSDQAKQIVLDINAGPEADIEELEKLTQQLREELLELDVEAVDLVSAGEIPEKAKAGEPITWGVLLLTLAASGGVLTSLISLLQAWLTRHGQSRVTVKIGDDELTVTGKPTDQQQQVINTWLRRYRGFVTPDD
jgi:uncharacterized protein YajQ (UPF0234 family)